MFDCIKEKIIITKEQFEKIDKVWGNLKNCSVSLKKVGKEETKYFLHIQYKKENNRYSFVRFYLENKSYTIDNFSGDLENLTIGHAFNMDIHKRVCETIKILGWLEDESR